MELDGAHGDAQRISNFLVDAAIKHFLEHFVFARAEFDASGKTAAKMEEFLCMVRDAGDQGVFGRDPHGVVGGRFAAGHAAESEQAGRAAEVRVGVAGHFDFEFRSSGLFFAEHQRGCILR